MNQELKAKWVAALRSGKYKQGKMRLRSENGEAYCCLGLLCEIEGGMSDGEWEIKRYSFDVGTILDAGLHSPGQDRSPAKILADMNDSGKTFAEIADHVEANL